MKSTGMIIDGIFASEAIDSSGEVLDIDGCDIVDFEEGKGVANYEHKNEETEGAFGQEVVGRIIFAKKIFKRADCDNERQQMYWDKVEVPFIYGIVRLADGAGHAGAKALAALIRDHNANGEPILVRYSIEGSTLKKEGQKLLRSVARRVAMTIKPCNRSCHSGLLEDPFAPEGFKTNPTEEAKDILDSITNKKSEHVHPMFTPLGGSYEGEYNPLVKEEDTKALFKTLFKLKAIQKLVDKGLFKATTAGSYDAAPGMLTGGAALQVEDLGHKRKIVNQAKAALRDYGKRVVNKTEFKAFLKARMPEAADEFIDHFVDRVHDFSVKKNEEELETIAIPNLVYKLENVCIKLTKAVELLKQPQLKFMNHEIVPGRAKHAKGEFSLLHENEDFYVGVPVEKENDYEAEDLVKLPKLKEATHYVVDKKPKVLIGGVPHAFASEEDA
jgi:hypothetical protein